MLRKQESRLFCAAQFIQHSIFPGQPDASSGLSPQGSGVLSSRLPGNDTLGLAHQGRGDLLHSAKMLLNPEV